MPATTILDLSASEQDQMLATLRRARYGYLLALHVLLLCAAGHKATEIAAFLFCSLSILCADLKLGEEPSSSNRSQTSGFFWIFITAYGTQRYDVALETPIRQHD